MAKFTDEECIAIIQLRNSPETIKAFEKANGNGYVIATEWENLARKVNIYYKGADVMNKYNYLIKEYRKKKVESKQSGSGGGFHNWKFRAVFENEIITGAEIVAPKCLDSAKENDSSLISDYAEALSHSPAKKAKVSAANEKVLEFLVNDSAKKFAFFEKLIASEQPGNHAEIEKRVASVETNLENLSNKTDKIMEILQKLYTEKKDA